MLSSRLVWSNSDFDCACSRNRKRERVAPVRQAWNGIVKRESCGWRKKGKKRGSTKGLGGLYSAPWMGDQIDNDQREAK